MISNLKFNLLYYKINLYRYNQEWLELVDQDYGAGQPQHGELDDGGYPQYPDSGGEEEMDGDPNMHSPGFNHLVLDSPQEYWARDCAS